MNRVPNPCVLVADLFLRLLGLVYLIAFVSLALQIDGLYGSRGILPVDGYLGAVQKQAGEGAWRLLPTLLWLRHDDAALVGTCWVGAASGLAMMLRIAPPAAAALCWALYFSLFQVGRVFLGFQWDLLLLESGFLAIFLLPFFSFLPERVWRRFGTGARPRPVVLWLLRWLLFRLMFASGMVKLLSHDSVWWNLTALQYHYWTQPLPTWTSWYAHQLPPVLSQFCVMAMFAIELVVPFALLGPRSLRVAAFAPLVALQVLIAATGNYTFFNLLTVALCVTALDDEALAALAPWLARGGRLQPRRAQWPAPTANEEEGHAAALLRWSRAARRGCGHAAAALLALAGGLAMEARLFGFAALPAPAARLVETLERYHVVGSYGLFSVMTKQRPEIILEGSLDGREWREYGFRWKPGDVMRAPAFVEPYQPRLDWQMWFAALGDWQRQGWLIALQRRLLEGSPPVLALLGPDPFGGQAPKFVRAMLYQYEFTDVPTGASTGAWWTRRLVGPYSPPLSR